jgi:hypothetical protein
VKHSFKLLPFNAILGTLPLALGSKDNVCTSLYTTGFGLCSVVAWRRRLAATNPERVEIQNADECVCRGVALGVTRPLIGETLCATAEEVVRSLALTYLLSPRG